MSQSMWEKPEGGSLGYSPYRASGLVLHHKEVIENLRGEALRRPGCANYGRSVTLIII